MSEANQKQSELVARAKDAAVREFSSRQEFLPYFRITLPRPHLVHLEQTVQLLEQCDFSPSVLAAAYLHDHERLIPSWSFGRLEREFGSRIALLATWHSQHDHGHNFAIEQNLHALSLRDIQESDSLRCAEQITVIRTLVTYLSHDQLAGSLARVDWTRALLRFEQQSDRLASHAHPFLASLMARELSRLESEVIAVLAPPRIPEQELEQGVWLVDET